MPGQGGWVCERELWRRRGKASWHLADGALPAPVPAGWQGISEAWELVEVELTQKARPRRGGRAQDPAAAHRRHHLLRPRRPACAAVGAARQRGAGAGRPPPGRGGAAARRCPASPTCRPGVMPGELASRGPAELGRLGAARSPLGPPPTHLGLGASWPAAVRQPARPPPAHRRPTRHRPAHHGRRPGPVPAQPRHPAGLGRRPSIAAHHRPALVEARPRLPGRHRHGGRWSRVGRGRPWPTTSPAMPAGCGRSAPPSSTTRPPGRSCGPSSPWPSRSACSPPRSNLAGRRQAIDPAEVKQAAARGHPAHGGGRQARRRRARRPLRPGRPRRPGRRRPRLGRQARPGRRPPADAEPLPADRRHLRHRQDHRHRTRSLPRRPRRPQVLPHRRQRHRPRLRRARPGRLPVGQPPRPRRPLARAAHGRLARQPRRHPQPAHGHARLDRALLPGRRLPPAPPGAQRPGRGRPRPQLPAS